MLIDDINFANLYQQQLALSRRTEKTPEYWDSRAEELAADCRPASNGYMHQLRQKIDLQGAETLFDMGCGPGTVALDLAGQLSHVYGVDYSQNMLDVSARRAQQLGITNASWIRRAWEEPWDDLPCCDIVVASRSTLVSDMQQAMTKLNQKARLRVYTTHLVDSTFMSPTLQQILGRKVIELPTYIYAVNILYQMGIRARVDFIRGKNYQRDNSTFARFLENATSTLGQLTENEQQQLLCWYQQQDPTTIAPPTRDWALIYWDCVLCGARK